MSNDLKLLEQGAELVGLKDEIELIEALAAIGKALIEDGKKVDGFASAEDLIDAVLADIDDANVVTAMEALGFDKTREKISDLFKQIAELKAKVPPKYRKLLKPISDFNAAGAEADSGLVEWTLLDRTQPIDVGDDLTLSVGGSAKLGFEAGDRITLPGADAPATLLRLDLEAGVNAKGGATIPVEFIHFIGGVEGALGLELACYFDTGNSERIYGVEVARRLPHLPNPFSFDGVWEAFGSADLGLTALVYTFTESGKVNVGAKLVDSASFGDVGLDVSLAIAAEAAIQSRFQLVLSATGPARADRPIQVQLIRGAERKAGVTAGLTVGVDFTIPAAKVHDILKKAVDKWDSILGEITPYLSPGTLLQTRFRNALETDGLIDRAVGKLLDNSPLGRTLAEGVVRAIEQDLGKALGGGSTSESAVKAWLSTRIEKAIDKGATELTGDIEKVRDAALDELKHHLSSSLIDSEEIRTLLSKELDPLIAKAKDALTEKINEIINRPGNLLEKSLGKLKLWGNEKINDINQITEPLRVLIERYTKLLHDALDVASDASHAKVSASLQIESQRIWGETDQIVGTFTARSAEAGELFKRLTHGKLAELAAMVHSGTSPTDDFKLGDKSFVKQSAHVGTKTTLAYVLFGFAASSEALLTGDATLVLDANGNVQVDDRGSASKRYTSKGETREVAFVDTHALRRVKTADGNDADFDLISVAVTIVDQDKAMKLGELQRFIRSLERVGMLRPGTADRATPRFAGWAGSDNPEARVPASIAAKLDLSKDQVIRLMQLDRRDDDDKLDKDAAMKILRLALAAQKRAGVSSLPRLAPALEFLADNHSGFAGLGRDEILYRLARKRIAWEHEMHFPGIEDEATALRGQIPRIRGLFQLIEELGKIWKAVPQTPLTPGGWSEGKYASRQAAVAEGAGPWLFTNAALFEGQSAVHPVTAAFLRTLADMVGIPEGSGLAIDFTPKDKDGKLLDIVTLT